MSQYNQSHQGVDNQYNAARDLIINAGQNHYTCTDQARLQIRRRGSLSAPALNFRVHVNGRQIGTISNGSRQVFVVSPGDVLVQLKWMHEDSEALMIRGVEKGDLVKVECVSTMKWIGAGINIWHDCSL